MAKLICRAEDIGYTILPYSLDTPIQDELIAHPSDYVLGYVTHNEETDEHRFTYTESGGLTDANEHWSLSIVKQFPYCEKDSRWIVYSCTPGQTTLEFGKILGSGETLHIDDWDVWSVEGKEYKVAFVTSWELY